MLQTADSPWEAEERSEIIAYIPIDYESTINFRMEKTETQEGCCFAINNACAPFRWDDFEAETRATHVAVSDHNVMYLKERYVKHVVVPCPPCACCFEMAYREDFAPRIRKLIPIEKITDVEVHDSGSNELVVPCCSCNPVSIEVPITQSFINTAGGSGVELTIGGIQDAKGFRRLVMDLRKRGAGGGGALAAPAQMGMGGGGTSASQLGASSEMLSVLKDIANSNRELVKLMQK